MIRQWLIQGSDQISFPRVLNLGYETYPITLDGFSFSFQHCVISKIPLCISYSTVMCAELFYTPFTGLA